MDSKIFIHIDCYECGEKVFIPFDFKLYRSEYGRCGSCGSTIEILFDSETKDLNVNYLLSE